MVVSLRPGGPSVSVRGTAVAALLVIVLCTGAIGYLVQVGFDRMVDQLRAAAAAASQESSRQMTAHVAITRSQDRTSCLLALNVQDRESFRREWRPGSFGIWCPWLNERVEP
jgi:hypothetical protein